MLVAGLVLAGGPGMLRAQELLETRGDSLLRADALAEAERFYRGLLRQAGREADANVGLARVALRKEEWNDAEELLARALKREPGRLEAHYYRGIALREMAKFRTPLQILHWKNSARHFETVLARDSLYRDVLYQYALLRRYDDRFREAIELAHAQLRLHPAPAEAHAELFRFYRSLLHHDREAAAWLAAQPSAHAAFFRGELLRRDGRADEADALFARLLADSAALPPQPVLLARARIRYAQDAPGEGQRFVEEAIRSARSPLEAALVFEDFGYLATDDELAAYRAARTPDDFAAFFRQFWAKRDPTPADPVNRRLAEHYRRLLRAERDFYFDGFRLWHVSPDKLHELPYPEAYALNRQFNDKGVVFLRHGEPDDRIVAAGADVSLDEVNESWRYRGREPMDFHFWMGGVNNDWRLGPRLWTSDRSINRSVLESREEWGGVYHRLASLARDHRGDLWDVVEFNQLSAELADQSRETVELALTTDRHRWADEVEPLEVPYVTAAFRGADGRTELELHYALPVDRIARAADRPAGGVEVEAGFAVHDRAWSPVAREVQTSRIPPTPDPTAAAVDVFRVSVPPDSYHVALHARPQGTPLLGGYRFDLRAPDFSAPGLRMSDLLLARRIEPAVQPSRFDRHGLRIAVNPTGRFSRREPLHLYYEIYHLTPDAAGRASFDVEYTLVPAEERRGLRRLFRRSDRPVLSLRANRSGAEQDPVEHGELDVSRVDPGRYRLTVRVTDTRSGASVERSREIELSE